MHGIIKYKEEKYSREQSDIEGNKLYTVMNIMCHVNSPIKWTIMSYDFSPFM